MGDKCAVSQEKVGVLSQAVGEQEVESSIEAPIT